MVMLLRTITEKCRLQLYLPVSVLMICLLNSTAATAHGSVAADDDSCLIQIGYLEAHFKIYLPRTHRFEEFCEDLPEVTESLFVLEYSHDGLRDMWIDFRIIRDVTGLGKFTNQADIAQIEDIQSATVFRQAATIEPEVYSVVHHFDEPGWYIGIITATTEDQSEIYTAVFPFEVGFTGLGYWPFFMLLIVLLQLFYWYTDGTLSRWREKIKVNSAEVEHHA